MLSDMSLRDKYDYFTEVLHTALRMNNKVEMMQRNKIATSHVRRPVSMVTTHRVTRCSVEGQRECEDGSCIARVDLCRKITFLSMSVVEWRYLVSKNTCTP